MWLLTKNFKFQIIFVFSLKKRWIVQFSWIVVLPTCMPLLSFWARCLNVCLSFRLCLLVSFYVCLFVGLSFCPCCIFSYLAIIFIRISPLSVVYWTDLVFPFPFFFFVGLLADFSSTNVDSESSGLADFTKGLTSNYRHKYVWIVL